MWPGRPRISSSSSEAWTSSAAASRKGGKTFANTLKYVLTTMSANLGNMISMAAASLFLPFLPLLAGQILLNNLLSDVPAIGIADDAVDPELIARPQRWNMRFIGRFMLEFGAVSSVFDFLTFGALLLVFHAAPDLFRTGWFVESLLTELVIALVVRTRRPFFRSRPGRRPALVDRGARSRSPSPFPICHSSACSDSCRCRACCSSPWRRSPRCMSSPQS